ncbi:MAG: hypothetical protein H0T46_05475 [Deltaproteobacteria bacterium]|nr:hypothetical protein [Deltaproteobacteria bacterium]
MGRAVACLCFVLAAGCDDGGGGGSNPLDNPLDGPPAGNPNGTCPIPAEARAEDTSTPTSVVGTGTPASCTGEAFATAVAAGGIITFDCGPDPVTIDITRTAKVFNDTGPKIVIDGAGKVVLDGKGKRIVYMNTCDQAQKWTTGHCQNQDHPQLTIQNLTFVNGDASGDTMEGGGGGAVFVRGGRLKIVNSRFFANRCDSTGPDVGGASVRTLSQYQPAGMAEPLPVYVVNTTFGGAAELGNTCSNGGGLSSIGVSHTVINSLFTFNKAIGNGANPAKAGTPGGGSGAAIYNDGNEFTLSLCGTEMTDNDAIEGGGAIFFVSNNRTGHLKIDRSVLRRNPSHGFETLPGIFVLAAEPPQITNSTIE